MGLNVDEILKRLGRQKTAEEQLLEGLSEKPAEVKTEVPEVTPVEEKKAEEVETPVVDTPVAEVEAAPVEVTPVEAAPVEAEPVEETKSAATLALEAAEKAFNDAKAAFEAEQAEKLAAAAKIDEEKLASIKDAEDTGRIMARGFHDELKKLAEAELTEQPVEETAAIEEQPEELNKKAQVLVNLYTNLFGGNE